MLQGWSESGPDRVYRGHSPSVFLQPHFADDLLNFEWKQLITKKSPIPPGLTTAAAKCLSSSLLKWNYGFTKVWWELKPGLNLPPSVWWQNLGQCCTGPKLTPKFYKSFQASGSAWGEFQIWCSKYVSSYFKMSLLTFCIVQIKIIARKVNSVSPSVSLPFFSQFLCCAGYLVMMLACSGKLRPHGKKEIFLHASLD